MRVLTINKNQAEQRLDKFLAKYMNLAGKSFFYKMMRKKNIVLNGKKCTGSEHLKEGDLLTLFLSDETIEKFSDVKIQKVAKIDLDIIYEDEHILLINKPVGMLSQKAAPQDESLVEYLIDYLLNSNQLTTQDLISFKPSVCNRLDRNTSGIIAAGKSLKGLQMLSEVFKSRSIHKYYRCIVKGELKEKQTIRGYLKKDRLSNCVFITQSPEGDGCLPIETRYVPLSTSGKATLLDVTLITGRSHQIRAHLSSISHPILGDGKYGDIHINQELKKQYGVKNQLLHSYKIVFPRLPDPFSYLSEKEFTAPVPELFSKVMKGESLWEPGIPED